LTPAGTDFALIRLPVKVRIRSTPREQEVDGIRLDRFTPGTVRDVSPVLAAWLVAERYADLEMRQSVSDEMEDFSGVKDTITPSTADDRPRRRSTDR
jgi:hypothetical protein